MRWYSGPPPRGEFSEPYFVYSSVFLLQLWTSENQGRRRRCWEERTNVYLLRDLLSVTLYLPHISLCAIKKKRNVRVFNVSQPSASKNGPWDEQLVFVSKIQIGHINATAFWSFWFWLTLTGLLCVSFKKKQNKTEHCDSGGFVI